jgi:hypothetical protein
MTFITLKGLAEKTGRSYDNLARQQGVWREYGLVPLNTSPGGDNIYILEEAVECFKRIAKGKKVKV